MPANFEYKPLGYQVFAQPLSQMQQYYDATRGAIEDLDFEIQHLPWGTDPERAKALAEEMKIKKDELTQNLIASKDYRVGARNIKGIQKDWEKNAERRALVGQHAGWQKLKEEQKKRIGAANDSLTRKQYQQWLNKSIRDFKKAGGTSFQADELDGTWNIIGARTRIGDKTKEIKKEAWEAAKAMTPKKWTKFQSGIQGKRYRNITKNFERLTPEEIAAAVEDYLKDKPEFMEWAAEAANYDLEELLINVDKKTGIAEEYNKVADELIGNNLKKINTSLKYYDDLAKKSKKYEDLKKSDTYKNLVNLKETLLAEQTNQLDQNGLVADPNLIKKLFFQDYLHDVFDADSLGKLFEVDNVTQSQSFNVIPGAHGEYDKFKYGEHGKFDPNVDIATNYDLSAALSQQGTQLQSQLSTFNNIANGAFGKLSLGIGHANFYKFNGQNYRKVGNNWQKQVGNKYVPLTKGDVQKRSAYLNKHAVLESDNLNKIENAGELYARQTAILEIFNEEKNKNKDFTWKDFKRSLWNGGITKNRGIADKNIEEVFNTLNNKTSYSHILNSYLELDNSINNYEYLNQVQKEYEKGFENSQEYQNYIDELGFSKPFRKRTGIAQQSYVSPSDRLSFDPESSKNVKGKDFTKEDKDGKRRLFTFNNFDIFKPEHYSDKQLKKIGLSKEDFSGQSYFFGLVKGRDQEENTLTFEQVALLQGYKSFKDAIEKGYHFNGFTPDGSYNTMTSLVDLKKKELIENNPKLSPQLMSMRFTGNENVNEQLENTFQTMQDLTSFKPAGKENFSNVPGFDDEGNPLEGTALRPNGVFLNKLGSQLLYEVIYEYYPPGASKKSENKIFVHPKRGTYNMQSDLLSTIKMANLNSPNSPLKKENLDMINAALFNLEQTRGQTKLMPFNDYKFDNAEEGDILYSMPSPLRDEEDLFWNFYKEKEGIFEDDFVVKLKVKNRAGEEAETDRKWNSVNETKAYIADLMGWGIISNRFE